MQSRISFSRKLKLGILQEAENTGLIVHPCIVFLDNFFSERLLHMTDICRSKIKIRKYWCPYGTFNQFTSGFPASLPASDKWQHPGNSQKSYWFKVLYSGYFAGDKSLCKGCWWLEDEVTWVDHEQEAVPPSLSWWCFLFVSANMCFSWWDLTRPPERHFAWGGSGGGGNVEMLKKENISALSARVRVAFWEMWWVPCGNLQQRLQIQTLTCAFPLMSCITVVSAYACLGHL